MEPLKISGVKEGKDIEQGRVAVDVTAVSTYKNPFEVNGKLVTVSLTHVEWVGMQHHIFVDFPANN